MIRFGRGIALAITVAALAACDIDFVAIEDTFEIGAVVRSEHVDAFTAELTLTLPATAAPATVLVDGQQVPLTEEHAGRRTYRTEIEPDSLHPTLRLTIQPGSGTSFETDVPMVARRGPAHWSSARLHLPLAVGAATAEPHARFWQVAFYDRTGVRLLGVGSDQIPLPVPLFFDQSMVPDSVVEARLLSVKNFAYTSDPHIVRINVISAVAHTVP